MMRAALYLRVSTQEQVDNYSIEAQRERLEAYCKSKGWTIYDIYVDGGYSGANMDRPALQQMLSDLPNIDVVVVYRLDRLSRSQRDTLTLIEDYFLKADVDFVSITETLDTSTPFGKAMIGILSVFAQLERETITERMRLGQIKRAEEGLAAMGGDYDPAGYARQDGKLIIKPDEAEHIRTAFDLYEQLLSVTKVQRELKRLGYPVWRFRRYRDILSNKLYCGYVSYAGKYYKGQHEPIISEEQFERVQVLLSRHKGHNAHKAKQSLFSGLVRCGRCGEPYVSYHTSKSKYGVYRYYICRAKRFPSEYERKCENKTWNVKKLEEIVQHELSLITLDKEVGRHKTKEVDYSKLIKNVDVKIERILTLYADGEIDRSALDRQIEKLNEEKNKLLQEQRNQDAAKKKQITKEELDRYRIDLTGADFAVKQAIIEKLIKSITINGKSISIEWRF
jgi:site-specific DNA recombinase